MHPKNKTNAHRDIFKVSDIGIDAQHTATYAATYTATYTATHTATRTATHLYCAYRHS